jgi:hypothetical protein
VATWSAGENLGHSARKYVQVARLAPGCIASWCDTLKGIGGAQRLRKKHLISMWIEVRIKFNKFGMATER